MKKEIAEVLLEMKRAEMAIAVSYVTNIDMHIKSNLISAEITMLEKIIEREKDGSKVT